MSDIKIIREIEFGQILIEYEGIFYTIFPYSNIENFYSNKEREAYYALKEKYPEEFI